MGYATTATGEGTGEIVPVRRSLMDRIAAEHRELADQLAIARADNKLLVDENAALRLELDEQHRRIEIAASALDPTRSD